MLSAQAQKERQKELIRICNRYNELAQQGMAKNSIYGFLSKEFYYSITYISQLLQNAFKRTGIKRRG